MKKLTVRGISTHEESKGEWKYGYLIEDEGVSYIINGVAEANDEYISIGEWCSVDPETLGLSTGLFDKKGAEIFEGDILADLSESGDELVYLYVIYKDGKFMAVENEEHGYSADLIDCATYHTVVGNIYENAKLLGR